MFGLQRVIDSMNPFVSSGETITSKLVPDLIASLFNEFAGAAIQLLVRYISDILASSILEWITRPILIVK